MSAPRQVSRLDWAAIAREDDPYKCLACLDTGKKLDEYDDSVFVPCHCQAGRRHSGEYGHGPDRRR